jgi:MEMO1 family protein
MIVFAAFTPHTPLLVPTAGQGDKLSRSIEAMRRLSEELYAAAPDTIVVLSSHGEDGAEAFSANLHDPYAAGLAAFGDHSPPKTFAPDLAFIDAMQRSLRRSSVPFTLDSAAELDHGAAVPLLLLTEPLPSVRIVPVSFSGLSPKDHLAFGRALKDVALHSPRRIALIASGDLSHALSSAAPAGYRPEGEEFDRLVRQAVEHVSSSQLLQMPALLVATAAECAYRPLLMLFGALEGLRVRPEILAYESPFGVGYLTAQFHLS